MQVSFPNFNQNQASFLVISKKRHRSCRPYDVYRVRSVDMLGQETRSFTAVPPIDPDNKVLG